MESCTFTGTALAAILVAPDLDHWYEMSPAHDLTIRENIFDNCGEYAPAVIQITTSHDTPDKTYPAYLHSDIRIEGNRFNTLRTRVLYAVCMRNLTAKGNEIDAKGYREELVYLSHCDKIKLDSLLADRVEKKDVTDLSVID